MFIIIPLTLDIEIRFLTDLFPLFFGSTCGWVIEELCMNYVGWLNSYSFYEERGENFIFHLDGFQDNPLAALSGFSDLCYVYGQAESGSGVLFCVVP